MGCNYLSLPLIPAYWTTNTPHISKSYCIAKSWKTRVHETLVFVWIKTVWLNVHRCAITPYSITTTRRLTQFGKLPWRRWANKSYESFMNSYHNGNKIMPWKTLCIMHGIYHICHRVAWNYRTVERKCGMHSQTPWPCVNKGGMAEHKLMMNDGPGTSRVMYRQKQIALSVYRDYITKSTHNTLLCVSLPYCRAVSCHIGPGFIKHQLVAQY